MYCRFCGSEWQIWAIWWVTSQRKTHQIAQIRHLEPQKRQYTATEVRLHLFWALT